MIDLIRIKDSVEGHFSVIANDGNFQSGHLMESTYTQYSIKHLSYSAEKSFKNEGEEEFSMHNAPIGMAVTYGKRYPYVEFNYAITGNPNSIESLGNSTEFRANGISYNPHNQQKYFVFRRYSEIPIIGNEELLSQINNEAKSKKELIEVSIKNFNDEADEANVKIKEIVDAAFLNEKLNRELKRFSMDKLNPF